MKVKTRWIILLIIGIILLSGCVEEKPTTEMEWFQTGNTQDITQLQPKQSKELEDNRIGGMWVADIYSQDDLNWFVNDVGNNLGLKWIRLSFNWFDWEEIESSGEYSEYNIGPYQSKAITTMDNNGVEIMYNLLYWDREITIELGEEYSRFRTEKEIQRYRDYVRFIVSNLKDNVEYYEILNEPNIGHGTQQHLELAEYIKISKEVIPVIRQEDPDAKIVVGATANFRDENTREYLFGILRSDLMPLVDGVSWHAMYGDSPAYNQEYYYNYPSLVQEIRDTASDHGFKGEYIAEEMSWRTSLNPSPYEPAQYTDIVAAKYYARAVIMHLGMDVTTGLGELETDVDTPKMKAIQNLCTIMAGAKPTDLPIEIQSEATNIRSYGFSLSNGDNLIALWTDGIAADEDPGVSANLVISSISVEKITATDVLNGYQQQIITGKDNGNLTIQNLIVRDYPMTLHIRK